MTFFYDFGQDNGGIQAISDEAAASLPPWLRLVGSPASGFKTELAASVVQPVVSDQWADLQRKVIAIYGSTKGAPSSVKTGANDGWIIEWSQDPASVIAGQMATADPAGFAAYSVPSTPGYLPVIVNAHYVPDWNAALKAANNGGGWVEVVANIGLAAAVSAAAWNLAGSLSTDGFSLGAEATEEITVSMTDTQGVSTVGETGMEWYSVDPGPDPFATTADVNAGWSFDGGYAGVDWYNSAGVGEINAADSSLWDIFGKATTAVKQGLGAVVAASGALQATRNNLAKPVPNYTRAAGGINVGLLAVGLLAWKLL